MLVRMLVDMDLLHRKEKVVEGKFELNVLWLGGFDDRHMEDAQCQRSMRASI